MTEQNKASWTTQESSGISDLLEKNLGPEYITYRAAAGRMTVPYIEGWKVIRIANEIFGYNGWNSEIKNLSVDYTDENDGKISMGVSAIVRVVLKDGTYHEDCGFGSIENCRSKALAYDKCRKEACTDGLKRTLKLFGSAMGNCLNDKDYIRCVARMKQQPKKFDEETFFRPDTSRHRVQKNMRGHGNAGSRRDFNERPRVPPVSKGQSVKIEPTPAEIPLVDGVPIINSQDFFSDFSDGDELPSVEDPTASQPVSVSLDELDGAINTKGLAHSTSILNDSSAQVSSNSAEGSNVHIGFVSGRAASTVQSNKPLSQDAQFDPSFQSPSIRRTVDHTKSAPIKRTIPSAVNTPSRPPLRTPLHEKSSNVPNGGTETPLKKGL